MKVKERMSKNLGTPYVFLPDSRAFVCQNGVMFTEKEYDDRIDFKSEYEKRSKGNELYDYEYARKKGKLRLMTEIKQTGGNRTVMAIVILLAFTSVISMYISTLHTATYLYDYVDMFSAWLMSASVTAYNGTAFEVSVIFKKRKRYGLTTVFITLWTLVTLFSMATTVSVFYDRFNFTETQIAGENKTFDSSRLSLEILQKKEADLREAIAIKVKDLEYRQEREYATATVRKELNVLQEQLQKNLSEQQGILADTPEVTATESVCKESLFSFLGRKTGTDGGILEFFMSVLSAIFVNLIAPLSLTAVTELMYKKA
jgi:hypothetical protein